MRTKFIVIPGAVTDVELTRYFTRQQRWEAFQALRNHVFRCGECKPYRQCHEFKRLYGIMTASQLEATLRATAEHQAFLASRGEFTNEHMQELLEMQLERES